MLACSGPGKIQIRQWCTDWYSTGTEGSQFSENAILQAANRVRRGIGQMHLPLTRRFAVPLGAAELRHAPLRGWGEGNRHSTWERAVQMQVPWRGISCLTSGRKRL